MSRMFLFAAIVAAAGLLPGVHSALAAPEAKVNVCHMNSSNTAASLEYDYSGYEIYYGYWEYSWDYHYTYAYNFGNVISVAESSVSSHVAHGDSTTYGTLDSWTIDYLENWNQYDYSTSYSYDYGWYYYSYDYSVDYTNGDIKNGDCYTWTYTEN